LAKLGATPDARAAKAKTPREQAYLAAVETLFADGEKNDRDRRYALAMEQLHAKYPDDVDATCFYALALLGTSDAGRDVPTYMRAAALMEEVFERNPQHPGAAHYLIHSVDDSVHAPLGLRAAYAYAKIAPDSPHAQHMTSHIFLALGMWDETAAANEQTIKLINNFLRARDKDAALLRLRPSGHVAVVRIPAAGVDSPMPDAWSMSGGEEMRSHPVMPEHEMGAQSALDSDSSSAASFAVMRSRYLIDSGEWSGPVAAMKVNVAGLVTAEFTRDWADAYGALRFGKLDAATAAAERAKTSLKRYVAAVTAAGIAADAPEQRVAKIEQQQLDGLLLLKRNRINEGITLLSEAAVGESASPMEFGPPSLDKPANELLGEVLLEHGRAKEACKAFEAARVRAGSRPVVDRLVEVRAAAGNTELADNADARLAKVRRAKHLQVVRSSRLLHNCVDTLDRGSARCSRCKRHTSRKGGSQSYRSKGLFL
jgi:hypothetical protein